MIRLFPQTTQLIFAVALAVTARAQDATPDQWGQTPKPELVAKVDKAVTTSRSDLAGAERLLREVVAADPDYYRAQLNLGLLVLQQGRDDKAADELLKALAVQQRRKIEDPTIYAELGFAQYRADHYDAATASFQKGVEHVAQLSASDQKKLLLRGVAFLLEYQNPAGARKLVAQAGDGLKPEVLPEIMKSLNDGIDRLTRNDVQEGWVRFAKQPTGSGPEAIHDQLFKKVNGEAGPIKKGDIVTPATEVNMRADRLHPEKSDSRLAPLVGTARLEERFEVVEVVPVPSEDEIAIWMRVRRVKPENK